MSPARKGCNQNIALVGVERTEATGNWAEIIIIIRRRSRPQTIRNESPTEKSCFLTPTRQSAKRFDPPSAVYKTIPPLLPSQQPTGPAQTTETLRRSFLFAAPPNPAPGLKIFLHSEDHPLAAAAGLIGLCYGRAFRPPNEEQLLCSLS